MSNAKTVKATPSAASKEAAENLLALSVVLPVVSLLVWWLAPIATAGAFDPGWWQSVAITTLLVFVARPTLTRTRLVVRVKRPEPVKVDAVNVHVADGPHPL